MICVGNLRQNRLILYSDNAMIKYILDHITFTDGGFKKG